MHYTILHYLCRYKGGIQVKIREHTFLIQHSIIIFLDDQISSLSRYPESGYRDTEIPRFRDTEIPLYIHYFISLLGIVPKQLMYLILKVFTQTTVLIANSQHKKFESIKILFCQNIHDLSPFSSRSKYPFR